MKATWTLAIALLAAAGVSLVALPAAEPAIVGIQVTKEHVTFTAGKELVTQYHIGPTVPKPFLWPVHGPGGVHLTRAWPIDTTLPSETKDHPHQQSLWFCHGDVIPEGIELKSKVKGVAGVDFWSINPGAGKIVCTEVGTPQLDKHHGQVTTKNEWRTADGTKIMDETRTIHLYDFGDARLLVFDIDLHASVAPITFGDTKEGAFGIRINDTIREAAKKDGQLENAEGKTGEKALWGFQSDWCDYSGTIDGKKVGLAVFDDPSNPYRACWHARGYGLLAANPFGREKSFPGQKGNPHLVKLAKGEHLKLRYGVLLHAGDAKEGKVAENYQKFVKLKG